MRQKDLLNRIELEKQAIKEKLKKNEMIMEARMQALEIEK